MQIHELNAFLGALNAGTFLAVDDGDDTGRLSIEALLRTVNERIDNIITSPAPTEQEIIDARRGWNEVVYGSLGTAIRSQVKQILAQFYKFNTYDLLSVYGTPISRTRNGVTFTWDDAGQVCEVSGEAVGGDAYASIYTQTGAWPGIFEHGVVYTIGYETTDPNVKLRIAVWEGVETTPDYYYFDENGYFGIPPEAAKISIDLWVASGDTVSAVVKNVYMLRTYTAKEVTATIRDAMIGADRHMYNSLGDAIREQLNGKVDKEEGMGLSQNSFTDAEKAKLEGIATGAQVNVIETVKVDGTPLTPDESKTVNIPVDDTLTEAGTPAEAKAVGDELEKKANSDGYYETLTSGQTEQIIATEAITDTEPYIYRKTGGPNDVGDRVYDEIVGGSIVWNQLTRNGNFADGATGWTGRFNEGNVGTFTVADGVASVHVESGESVFGGFSISNNKITSIIGHKYIFFATIQTTNGMVSIRPTGASGDGQTIYSSYPTKTRVGYVWNCAVEKPIDFRLLGYAGNGVTSAVDFTAENLMCVDLTAALGSTNADYIYSLEQATAGAGVAYFKKYFPEEYHEFCEPHFEHVQTSAKETIGFNQWDEEWESGYINANGTMGTGATSIRSKNFCKCLPNTAYCFTKPSTYMQTPNICWYDANKTFIEQSASTPFPVMTSPSNAHYFKISCYNYGATYKNDICINLHGDRDGEYEPYKKRTYPLDSSLTLRGIPKLDSANRLYFDGDIYRHDGSGERRYSVATLNECANVAQAPNGNYYTSFRLSSTGVGITTTGASIITLGYSDINSVVPGQYYITGNGTTLVVCFTDQTLTTKEMVDAYLANHPFTIVYELNTPEPFTAEPYQYPMVVDPLGTEEFIDYGVEQGDRDVAIPVGHKSEYPPDLRGKLQHLPGLSSNGDGRYVVVQTGNQMTLSPDTSLGLIAALEARVAALEGGN